MEASRGILEDSSKKNMAKSSSSHDFNDIAAGGQGWLSNFQNYESFLHV
jgi:hypothetical protein